MHYREDVPSRFNLIKQFAYLPICRVEQIKPDGESSREEDRIGSALQGSGSLNYRWSSSELMSVRPLKEEG